MGDEILRAKRARKSLGKNLGKSGKTKMSIKFAIYNIN
jgi:hypothetical protein